MEAPFQQARRATYNVHRFGNNRRKEFGGIKVKVDWANSTWQVLSVCDDANVESHPTRSPVAFQSKGFPRFELSWYKSQQRQSAVWRRHKVCWSPEGTPRPFSNTKALGSNSNRRGLPTPRNVEEEARTGKQRTQLARAGAPYLIAPRARSGASPRAVRAPVFEHRLHY